MPSETTAKHTPGPWRYRDDRSDIVSCVSWYQEPLDGDDGLPTRIVDLVGAMGGDNTTADAKLIAAAPELLEACRAALRMCEAMESSGNMVVVYNAHDAIKGAIAKAEGK